MRKKFFSVFALILAALLLLPLLSSCDFLKDILKIHNYEYFYDLDYHWQVCADCGEKTAGRAHSFLKTETVAATCECRGYITSKCVVCGYMKTDFLPKTEHEFQTVEDSDTRECVKCHRKESALVELDETERYGYTCLSALDDGEKYIRAYDKISAAVAARSDKANIYDNLTKTELSTVFYSVFYDHPEYFWLDTGYEYTTLEEEIREITFNYVIDKNDLPEAKALFNRAADDILSGVSTSMTDFEKEVYIHDAIVKSNSYDETHEAPMMHSAYGALVLKSSVCDGYSKLFSYLMARCGVLTAIFSGYTEELHSWNAVQIDGEWYMVDVTWDDPIGQKPGEALHTYFNRTWDEMSFDHSFDASEGEYFENYYPIPVCNSDDYYYFKYFGYEARLIHDEVERVIRKYVANGESNHFQILIKGIYGTPEQKKQAIEYYILSDVALYASLEIIIGKPVFETGYYWSTSSDGNILNISVD